MSITRVGTPGFGANSATFPAHLAGDLLLVFAFRDGAASAPTLPAGWTNINAFSTTSAAARIGYKFATGPGTASDTWVNATSCAAFAYRGVHPTTPTGNVNNAADVTAVATYPALSMVSSKGNNWVFSATGHRSLDTNLETPPTGMANWAGVVDAASELAIHDTNGGVAAWTAQTVSLTGTASGHGAFVIELRAIPTSTIRVWNGSAWVAKPAKAWSGSAWAAKPVKVWNGSAWIGPAAAGPYADNFDRADANLESSPVASGGWSWVWDGFTAGSAVITSNTVRSNHASSTGSAYKTPALASADHYVQYRVATTTAATGPFACCRLAASHTFVGIRSGTGGSAGQVEVYRRVSGTLSSLYASPGGTVVVGDVIRLECLGTDFTVKKNGAVLTGPTPINNATLTNVGTGFVMRGSTVWTMDDFEAGAL